MPQELTTEYDIDRGEYLNRVEKLVTERHPPARPRHVEEVLFADDGPIEYLAWFALDGYDDHTFFYYDSSPDSEFLQLLLSIKPNEDEMPKLRALLRSRYETFEASEAGALFEIPDTYLPQFTPRPRAHIGFFYSPVDDKLVAGTSARPQTKTQEILEDVEKLLPNDDVEAFVTDVVEAVYDEIEAEIERRVLEIDVRPALKADSDFQCETVTTIPDDLHPEYGGQPGELWQKPGAKVEFLNSAQGFLQVWLPEETESVALVTATSGEYDEETVVEKTRTQLRQLTQKRSV